MMEDWKQKQQEQPGNAPSPETQEQTLPEEQQTAKIPEQTNTAQTSNTKPPENQNFNQNQNTNPNQSMQQSYPYPPQNYPQQGYRYPQGFYDYYQQPYQQGMFYGNPYAPRYAPVPPVQQSRPETPKPEPIEMNKNILTMTIVMAVLVFLLCIYCIIADIVHGARNYADVQTNATVVVEMQEKPDLNPEDENVTADGVYTVKGVAEIVKPSIVVVSVYTDTENNLLGGTGSGIIISEDGYIITNAHVVQGGSSYTITLDDESTYTAQVVGSDNKTDLAVLKINASGLTPAVLGNSDEVFVGEEVVAIGNPAGLVNSVTKGIVSAVNRQIRSESSGFIMDCIQTDAAISPGNSGGALVNMYGQVIGITSSKYASQYATTYEGLGFAITTNQALPVIQDLIENGYVEGRFRIGIVLMPSGLESVQMAFAEQYGADMPEELQESIWITEISEDCDIANTDLQPDDFILEMNNQKVSDYDSVLEALDGFHGGDSVTAKCARYQTDGSISYFTIIFQLEEDTSGNY